MTLDGITARLAAAGVPSPEVDAALLLSHFCGASAATLRLEKKREYVSQALEAAVASREARVPLQYIIGETSFYEESYLVTPDVLIPRFDTEILVEEAIARIPKGTPFADFCTGSGCVAISTLAQRPDLTAVAADVSKEALAVAMQNAERNGVADRLGFLRANLLEKAQPRLARFSVILSNPPYIASPVIPTLEAEVKAEPSLALDGGEDGLIFYKTFLSLYSPSLFLFEIGYDQGAAVCALGEEKGYKAEIKKDLGGCDRVVILARR